MGSDRVSCLLLQNFNTYPHPVLVVSGSAQVAARRAAGVGPLLR